MGLYQSISKVARYMPGHLKPGQEISVYPVDALVQEPDVVSMNNQVI